MLQNIAYAVAKVMPAAVATGLSRSVCSISAPSGNFVNGVADGVYLPVAGLQNVPCMDAPPSTARIQATEVKALAEIQSAALRHVLLNRYYVELDLPLDWGAVGWRATIDGTLVDIMGAESDSQHTQTRISVRVVSV